MQFTKLRLIGFKSFVEPQEFVIEKGLTGIVGPNGCGKSNLVEALRWVMGENSYKNMRASGMDDVIFSGSSTRPSRNAAEVILYLDNRDRSAPASFNEADQLQVSRRIERDHGSTYSINAKEVRAKDVQLLFADQSTGARSPSMVGQGKIGELIQAKPQARRALLEEAAGISGLYSRRNEAEMRLRAADTNLERLEDVVGDLSGRIDSLKRQARHANRFKSLSAQIREIEAGLFYLSWSAAKSLEIELESALTAATIRVAEQAQNHLRAEKSRDQAKGALPIHRENSAKAAAAHQRLVLALREIEAKAERDLVRKSEISRQLQQFDNDVSRERQLLQDNQDMLRQLDDEEQHLRDVLEKSQITQEEQRVELNEREARLQLSEAEFADLTARRAQASAEEVHIHRQLDEARQRQLRLDEAIRRFSNEIVRLDQRVEELTQKDDISQKIAIYEREIERLNDDIKNGENSVNKCRSQQAELRDPLFKARDALNILVSEKATLARLNESLKVGNYPPILEEINVEIGYELALGVALGDDLLAPLSQDAAIYWRDLEKERSHYPDTPLPHGLQSLAKYVDAPDALRRRLEQIGVVDDKEGSVLQTNLKNGQRLVSREGRLWRWDGLCSKADAPTASAQRLAQHNRMKELVGLIENAQQQLAAAEQRYQDNETELERTIDTLAKCRSALNVAISQREQAREDFATFQKNKADLNQQRAILLDNKKRAEADLEETISTVEELEIKLQNLPNMADFNEKLSERSQQLERDRQLVASIRALVQTSLREASTQMQRIDAIGNERLNWQNRVVNTQRQLASLEVRTIDLKRELENLAVAPDDFEANKQRLLKEIAQAEQEMRNLSDILAQHENKLAEFEEATAKAFVYLSQSREERARAEERLSAAIAKRNDIEVRIRSTLDCQPIETMKLAGFDGVQNLPEIATLEKRLDQLRLERERLGAVNLRAEEEESELRVNYEAITKERDDIVEAIKKLRQAIQSLNKEGRERLLNAFDKVNQEFQRLFAHLFDGGHAELALIESDDPLNAGLEIIARPPGKKPQTMTLLSGGEQALTAMSLIFAVFLTNPAPICVLDEVDAPLDDHNVERYCNLLDEMTSSTDTKFLVITHNPITMSRMSRLFGVTMAEQGVSQLVSVDLHHAEELAVQTVNA